MSELQFFLYSGFKHIIQWGAWDHILFILVLTLRYQWEDWRKIIILITAFTFGHSATLALSALNWIHISSNLVEFLIPITILITAISNFWIQTFEFKSRYPLIYFLAIIFGFIHGLGFSAYLKTILGQAFSIVLPLFSFNMGLEVGQLLIVCIILSFSFIFVQVFKLNRKTYLQVCSLISILLILNLIWNNISTILT